MHCAVLVIIEDDKDIEGDVESALEPYKDRKWDYYILGGRYAGRLFGDTWAPISQLPDGEFPYYAICSEDLGWQSRHVGRPYSTPASVELPMPTLKELKELFPNHFAVLVDCHN